jgi:hypothetical protein
VQAEVQQTDIISSDDDADSSSSDIGSSSSSWKQGAVESELAALMPLFDLLQAHQQGIPQELLSELAGYYLRKCRSAFSRNLSCRSQLWKGKSSELLSVIRLPLQQANLPVAGRLPECSTETRARCCKVADAALAAADVVMQELQVELEYDDAIVAVQHAVAKANSVGVTWLLVCERVMLQLGKQLQHCEAEDWPQLLQISYQVIDDLHDSTEQLSYFLGTVLDVVRQAYGDCSSSSSLAAEGLNPFAKLVAEPLSEDPSAAASDLTAVASEIAAAVRDAAVKAKFWSPSIMKYPVTLVSGGTA